jgi:hypothetical protein
MIRFRFGGIAVVTVCLAWPSLARAQAPDAVHAEQTRDANLRAYTALLRSDIRAQKVAVISELLELTDEEGAKFWPIYYDYEKQLTSLNDDRLKVIVEYADKYATITDAQADQLARRAIELEARRDSLLGTYYDRLTKAISAKTAVHALQVEHQILLLLDLQVAASLPIVESSSGSSR